MLLTAQGLERLPERPAVKSDILGIIRRIGLLQIDTIHVVARSPYLVLWSRLGDYPLNWLDELLAEGALFEYWAHAACFLPIEDYPLYRRLMLDAIQARRWPTKWAAQYVQEHPEIIERIRRHIQQNGAVRSADFENKNRPAGGWWNWKEEKDALEALFMTGELMIARRQKFQRVYDLRQRVLPDWDDANTLSSEAMQRRLALQAACALGVATPAWVAEYYHLYKKPVPTLLEQLASEGLLTPVQVEGIDAPAYLYPEYLGLLEKIASGEHNSTHTTLLSPFDPLVSDRSRARALFDFDYTIECYTPAAKRRYGYFTLPILHNGRLVGRLDPKAHRTQGLFEVKALHLEPGVPLSDELVADLAAALRRLAAWHGTPDLVIRQSDPPEMTKLLEQKT